MPVIEQVRDQPASTERPAGSAWAIFAPDGTFDGGVRSPKTIEDAQRLLARPQRWTTLAAQGWTVRSVTQDEWLALLDAANFGGGR